MESEQSERARDANRYVSRRLREIRKDCGLSQKQAGELLSRFSDSSWSIQAVSRAELCEGVYIKRWNVDDLYSLAAAFEVPVSYFLPAPLDINLNGMSPTISPFSIAIDPARGTMSGSCVAEGSL